MEDTELLDELRAEERDDKAIEQEELDMLAREQGFDTWEEWQDAQREEYELMMDLQRVGN